LGIEDAVALKISCGLHRQTVRQNETLPFSFVLMLVCAALIPITASGQVWMNSSSGTLEWQDPSNWGGTAPSTSQPTTFITNAVNALSGFRSRTVSIDSTTSSGSITTMTINNLTISAPGSGIGGSHNALFLNNAGLTTPLEIKNSLTISSSGAVNITNSVLLVDGLSSGVLSDDGTITLNTGTITTLNNGSLEAHIGDSKFGQLTVFDGTWHGDFAYVGFQSGSQGTLTMDGGTISLGNLYVGHNGTGTVWMTGGQLSVGEFLFLGNAAGQMAVSNGTANVNLLSTGGGSTLTIAGGSVTVASGGIGLGILEIFSGGTVWLTGGQLQTVSAVALIGFVGNGQMTVSNGTWQAREIVVGTNTAGLSQGTLTIAGGTTTVNLNLTLGDFTCVPTGIVNVAGGELDVTNSLGSAVLEVRSGTFTLSGGILRADKIIVTNACAHFVRTGGTLIYGSAVLNPNDDTDGDGIPNGYEQSHGLDPLNAADASADNDGDGQSNLQEYLAGTDPNSSTSTFQIASMVITGNDLRVAWTMGPGKTNALQRTTGDGSGGYSSNNYANIFIVTNTAGTVTNFLDAGAATNNPSRYYRVRLMP
jgi:hypothetical protein